jgi:hypothetical protein
MEEDNDNEFFCVPQVARPKLHLQEDSRSFSYGTVRVTSISVSIIVGTVRSEIRCAIVSKNWIKQLHTLPVLHVNRCLTTEYIETTAHFNGNFDTDNQIYVT